MHIAQTVLTVARCNNPLVSDILNRSTPLTKLFAELVMSQTQFSYHGRKPKPAHNKEGQARKTNLDLLSLLVDLYKRSARVQLTAYDNQLPWQAFAGQQHVGGTRRFGNISGLISHRELLSFSLQIKDESVLQSDRDDPALGAHRTYMLADYEGAWHKGWHGFTWDMNSQEKSYLTRRNLLVDGNVDYEDYLHQNRRQSVMGAPYLLLKLLWQRMEEEISFFEREVKRLEYLGVQCPDDLKAPDRFKIAEGNSKSISVPTFVMYLQGMSCTGAYTPVSTDTLGYRLAHRTIRFLSHELRPIVQFMLRADEVAFYRFGLDQGFVSNWIKGVSWVREGVSSGYLELGNVLTLSYQKGSTEKKVAV